MSPEEGASAQIGAAPGTLRIPEGSPPPRIRLMEYDENGLEEREVFDVEELRPYARTRKTTWVDVQGLGDESILRRLAEIFGIHMLALADAVNSPQRAKMDLYEEHLLVIARAPEASFATGSEIPQVCLLVAESYLISFQERHFGFFEGLRDRIRKGGRILRTSGPGYLAYALVDSLVDHFYPVVEEIAEELDDLEESALGQSNPDDVARLHQVQRQITVLRRVIRPQVEVLHRLSSSDRTTAGETHFVPESASPFFRDAHDHALQIEGRLEAAREMAVDTMAAILANLGHRQNEIMKVLTLVGSIFIPLTFLAGIYGMNFEHMPELRFRAAYPLLLGVMLIVMIAMILFFRHKGWIGTRRRP
ncbi:MAG TPA: magnesium/cobalt transporter CorA [Myxococcota bacterium]|nr:magnesium/cobalt transporter CorA [Myxococcota bacterium]